MTTSVKARTANAALIAAKDSKSPSGAKINKREATGIIGLAKATTKKSDDRNVATQFRKAAGQGKLTSGALPVASKFVTDGQFYAETKTGAYLTTVGTVVNRNPVGLGGEAAPSGSYLKLAMPITVAGQKVDEVFLNTSLKNGAKATLEGRLDVGSYGGVETPKTSYFLLSGISNVGAGEPRYDGKKFTNAAGAKLPVLSYDIPLRSDGPAHLFVIDSDTQTVFSGTRGGFLRADVNPFHGFSGKAALKAPTAADQSAVKLDAKGVPTDVKTGEPLVLVGKTGGGNFPDAMSSRWYLEPTKNTLYRFESGGIAGFVNRMAAVAKVG